MKTIDSTLQRLVLLTGDKKIVKRLVLSAIERNPGQKAEWYVTKVLHDLERARS